MFKEDWEKTSTTPSLPPGMIDKMLWFEYPDKILISQELMAGGCANLNIKILIEGEEEPQILRIYLRDKDSADLHDCRSIWLSLFYVHADFDPSNILVNEVDGSWKVSGVLDWEFSFSGSVLWDVANMLRYAHKMPSDFQDAFL